MLISKDFYQRASVALVTLSLTSYPQILDSVSDNIVSVEDMSSSVMEELEVPELSIFFGHSETELSDRHEQQIKDMAVYLIKTRDTFEILGCASKKGNDDDNFWIARRRAVAVQEALKEAGVPVTKYEHIEDEHGNKIIGQDRDIITGGEDCPSLNEGIEDSNEESRRATIILNPPEYEEPPQETPSKSTSDPVNILDILNKILGPKL